MPYVCAPGRGQVDGQCSALREKEEPRVVRAACNNSALLRSLWPIPCSLWLPEQEFLDEERSVPCGDDRRSPRDAVTAKAGPPPIMSGIIFGETSFDRYIYLIRCARLPTSRISLEFGSVSKTREIDGATEMDSLACQLRTIDDRIAWKFTQPAF